MKGSKVRSMNYGNIDADDCGMPSTSKGATLNGKFCKFLEIELSNSKFPKLRKLSNKGKQVIISK